MGTHNNFFRHWNQEITPRPKGMFCLYLKTWTHPFNKIWWTNLAKVCEAVIYNIYYDDLGRSCDVFYAMLVDCASELMVLVTPEKMKNLPCSDPDTRPLPKLDIGRQSISGYNRRARFFQRSKFLQNLGPLFLRCCYPGIYDGWRCFKYTLP